MALGRALRAGGATGRGAALRESPPGERGVVAMGLAEHGLCLAVLGDALAAEDAVHLAVRDVVAAMAGRGLVGPRQEDVWRACMRRCLRPRGLPAGLDDAGAWGEPVAAPAGGGHDPRVAEALGSLSPAQRALLALERRGLAPRAAGRLAGIGGAEARLAAAWRRLRAELPGADLEGRLGRHLDAVLATPAAPSLGHAIAAGLERRPPRPVHPLPELRSPTALAAALATALLALTGAGGLASALPRAALPLPAAVGGAAAGPFLPDPALRLQLPARTAAVCPGSALGPPPSGAPLIWVALPCDPETLTAFDWNGHPRGRLSLDDIAARDAISMGAASVDPDDGSLGAGQAAILQSPDGRYLLIGGSLADTAGGERLTLPGEPARAAAVWADDSSHLCGFRNDSVFDGGRASYLFLAHPGEAGGGAIADLLALGRPGSVPASDVVACAEGAGRALVQRRGAEGVVALLEIGLRSPRILLTRPHAGDEVASVVATHDGSLIAENAGGPNVQGPLRAATVFSLPDEREQRAFPGVDIRGFSWDGALAVTSRVGIPDLTQVVAWRSGALVWSSGDGRLLDRVLAQPGGAALALAVAPALPPIVPGCRNPCEPVLPEIVIVRPDGTSVRLAPAAAPAW
jgi:hypothetical protein